MVFRFTIPVSNISIHASAKEATLLRFLLYNPSLFQSTPPRRRRLRPLHRDQSPVSISIHASAKEATHGFCYIHNHFIISIHASAKEATWLITIPIKTLIFQSTPPRRRRRIANVWYICSSIISIHASAKEATATYCDTSAIMYISSLNNFFVRYF